MVTLCCTKVLLKRLGPQSHGLPQPATCALGNWFANVIHVRAQPIVMAMSEHAFIPVLFPARSLRENLVPAFLQAVASLLKRIGAAHGTIERELALMSPAHIAPTNNRQVLSVMNQRALEVRFIAQHWPTLSLPEAELHFASGLAGPLGLVRPQEAALGLLSALHAGT